jgi:hypothetical protein
VLLANYRIVHLESSINLILIILHYNIFHAVKFTHRVNSFKYMINSCRTRLMFPKWKFLNLHWIEFTIQYGYMISTISLQYSWHPSHHHCSHIQVPNQLLTLPHMHLCVLLHFLNSDFTNQNNQMRKIHLFFKLLRRVTNKEYNFSFTVFTIQWISSIKCHFCSNQVTIMTNFKFV